MIKKDKIEPIGLIFKLSRRVLVGCVLVFVLIYISITYYFDLDLSQVRISGKLSICSLNLNYHTQILK